MRFSGHRLLMLTRPLLLMFLFVLLSQLSGDAVPHAVFPHGRLFNSCGPVDQPIVLLRLTTRRVACHAKHYSPYIAVTIGEQLAIPTTVTLGTNTRQPNFTDVAQRCSTDACDPVVSGTIAFEKVARDGIVGHYDLKLKSGEVISGGFVATWCHEHVVCW